MNAELVLEPGAEHIIALAQRSVIADKEFRHQKQRDTACAGRSVRQSRQHQMDDIVGEIMLAIGDEDLLAVNPVGAVADRHGARLERIEIGTGLRLGEVHRPHPFAGYQLFEILCLELIGGMLVQRLDRTHGQDRSDGKGE